MPLQNISADELRKKFLSFFEGKGHRVIPSSSLVPENDPTVLFTTAGMHPLVPYLLGEKHPEGTRLCNVQRCVRTDDIDEVGDETHLTFFEMLGNWSLGDYWKEDAIKWSYEFLTSQQWLGIDKNRLAVSVFAGDEDAPFDEESFNIWRSLGISEDRIAKLPKKDNWWGPAGQTGPCGPDTEMFIWTGSTGSPQAGSSDAPEKFDPVDKNWVEVWNDVFMQYNLTAHGGYEPLKQRNVDTGMGLERMLAILNNESDIYKTELFWPIIEKLEELSGRKYEDNKKEFRIIADHIKAAVFLISAGIVPSNKMQGYVLRRLIRRTVVKAREIGIMENFLSKLADIIVKKYYHSGLDPESCKDSNQHLSDVLSDNKIGSELEKEESGFRKKLTEGLELLTKARLIKGLKQSDAKDFLPTVAKITFDLFQSHGFPPELTYEYLNDNNDFSEEEISDVNQAFIALLKKHQELSRSASAGMFKGGLADNSEQTTKYHTAAHLMLVALKEVLGDHVEQKGSNINAERLRFDFNNSEKLTDEQIKRVEDIVNEQIQKSLPVTMQEMSLDEAKSSGAHGTFDDRYGNKVKVYTIGPSLSAQDESPFSREICGGPHVKNTSELGHFKIIKEESSSAGIRRIKAVLE